MQVHVGKLASAVVKQSADGLGERPVDVAEVAVIRVAQTAEEGWPRVELGGLRRDPKGPDHGAHGGWGHGSRRRLGSGRFRARDGEGEERDERREIRPLRGAHAPGSGAGATPSTHHESNANHQKNSIEPDRSYSGKMLTLCLKKFSGSYFDLIALSRGRLGP